MCDFPFVVIMLNLNVFWFLHFLLYDFHLEEIIPRSFHAAVGTDSPQGYHSLSILAFTNRKIFSMSHYGQNVSQVITLSPFKWDRPMKENFIMVVSNAHHFDVYFKGNFDCITFLGTLSNVLFEIIKFVWAFIQFNIFFIHNLRILFAKNSLEYCCNTTT